MQDSKEPQGNDYAEALNKLNSSKIIIRQFDITEEDYLLFKDSPYLSIDTEATGLNLNRDRLCLVQICNHERVLFVHYPQPTYSSPILQKLLSEPMEKLFHYARFDVFAIYKYVGTLCENIICTRLLSKVWRTFSDKHGLKHLLEELLGIKMNKAEQLSYWGNDSLTDSQREYAKKDVIYLKPLYDKIKWALNREGRWHIAARMCTVIPSIVLCEANFFDPNTLINYI